MTSHPFLSETIGSWLFLLVYLNAPFHILLFIYLFLLFFVNFVPEFHFFLPLNFLVISPR